MWLPMLVFELMLAAWLIVRASLQCGGKRHDVDTSPRDRWNDCHPFGTRRALFPQGGTAAPEERDVFVYAMLVMSLSGAVMAVGRAGAAINIPAGLVTAYLVITSLAHRSASVRGIAPAGSRARWWRRSRSALASLVIGDRQCRHAETPASCFLS